ncbi:MAG: aspartate--tRNA ligase [Rhodothermia bacterium]
MSEHPYRSHHCGALRAQDVGSEVVLKGWVDTRRDLGGVIFIDLRDRFGLTQVVFSPQDNEAAHAAAERLRSEFVISVKGIVQARSTDTINPRLPTGEVEVRIADLAVLNTSEPLPFSVSSHEEKQTNVTEELRLKYRYLDLRRPALQNRIVMRSKMYESVRRFFYEHDFVEVETPVLMKSTPEGARDYLVPSRLHPGKFYALPQSPQTYKQILMVSGLDRYFQIVKCFRDEDLRADRQPEFTQIDVEVSFATESIIRELVEGLMASLWKDVLNVEVGPSFPTLNYREAITRYGSDKPDLRVDLPIHNLADAIKGSPFRVFEQVFTAGGTVVGLRVPGEGERGRGAMDRLDKNIVRKKIGAGGLIYFKLATNGQVSSSIKEEVLPRTYVDAAIESIGGEPGDLILLLAGSDPEVYQQMGALRLHMADEMDLIDTTRWEFVWITDFPLVEWSPTDKRWSAVHHPFTSPQEADVSLMESNPGNVKGRAYDLVLNGQEVGGGSIRIHDRNLQQKMFDLLGINADEAERRFGFLLNAFRYGTPPHGGIALGLDRIVAALTGTGNIRDVIAFPKTQSAAELMVQSPDEVDDQQLDDLHIRIVEED